MKPSPFLGWLIPLAYIPFLAVAWRLHSVFNEWGGVMQWFAGRDILDGVGYRGWTAHFWPPLFSILMGVGGFLAPGFEVGKLIAACFGVLLLHLAYRLALLLSGRVSAALWTQVFLIANPLFFLESLTAHNHMLDAFFFVAGLYFFLKAMRSPTVGRSLTAGLVCGLGALTRGTSNVLVLLAVFPFLKRDRTHALRTSLPFLGGFLLVLSPWLVANTAWNGSPFSNWEPLNVAAGMLNPEGEGTLTALWRANAGGEAGSVLGLMSGHPVAYARNVVNNLVICVEKIVQQQGGLAPFVLAGAFDALVSAGAGLWSAVLVIAFLYMGMISQAYIQNWHLLPLVVPMTVLGVRLIVGYGEKIGRMYPALRRLRLSYLVLALLVLYGARSTKWSLDRMASGEYAQRPLAESREVAAAMKDHDPDIRDKIIMAIDPGRAYYAGGKYLMTPLVYDGPVTGLVTYEGLGRRIRNYAARFPADLQDFRADYLVFTRTEPDAPVWTLKEPPGFDFLMDPDSEQVPATFTAVYRSRNVVVYEIHGEPGAP